MRRLISIATVLVTATCTPGGADRAAPTQPALAQTVAIDADGLPDLIVDTKRLATSWHISDQDLNKQDACSLIEGGVTPGTHRVLRFTVTTPNVGTADLYVGNPLDHVAAQDGLFEFAGCHAHFHYRHYATYELVSLASGTPLVVRAAKRGFCMIDVAPWRIDGGGGGPRKFDSCGNLLVPGNQGISVGFADSYDKHIGGQYFVLDGADGQGAVPPGDYRLRIEVNPGFTAAEGEACPALDAATGLCHNFAELRYDNNVGEVLVTIPDRK